MTTVSEFEEPGLRRRIWGWFFFDWASQPYATLLLTFILAPYIKELMQDGGAAQAAWGYGVSAAGVTAALLAPLLGGIADRAGPRMRLKFIWFFSAFYVIGAWSTWWAAPDSFNLTLTLFFFGVGLIGMEFTTIFTNAMLPDLAPREEIGRISGTGWAFGYLGGLIALVFAMACLAENARTGLTLIGTPPILGLDPATREGTRAVGPFTAIWYILFMIPFFLWVREPRDAPAMPLRRAVRSVWPDLHDALRDLRNRPSLAAYLGASMFYRDALSGIYYFGGIYAAGVLGWSVTQVGLFGIVAVVTSAVFAWIGGQADGRYGPKPVIRFNILVLILVTLTAVSISRESVLGFPVAPDSRLPDLVFFVIGAIIGGTGGALQASSRTMMVRQGRPDHMAQSFGLYALTGKATSFLAPFSVAVVTDVTGSQQVGITPLLVLFLVGLILLSWVKPDGEPAP